LALHGGEGEGTRLQWGGCMSWLAYSLWAPALLVGLLIIVLCNFVFTKDDICGDYIFPGDHAHSDHLYRATSLAVGMLLVLGAVPSYYAPRNIRSKGFQEMFHTLEADAQKIMVDKLQVPFHYGWTLIWAGTLASIVLVANFTSTRKLGVLFACVEGTAGYWAVTWPTTIVTEAAALMCNLRITGFLKQMKKQNWKGALEAHRKLDTQLERLFCKELGTHVIIPHVLRSLCKGTLGAVLGVVTKDPLAKCCFWGYAVFSFAQLKNLVPLAEITSRCNVTSPRYADSGDDKGSTWCMDDKLDDVDKNWCIKAAAFHAAGKMGKDNDVHQFKLFLQYLVDTECGVELAGILLTWGGMLHVFARIIIGVPTLVGLLEYLG